MVSFQQQLRCVKPIPCHGMRWNGVSCTSAGINCVPRMAFRRGTQLGCIWKVENSVYFYKHSGILR